jgi:hypothetical protein
MKKPARNDYDQPPEVTPEYLDMLRRRWRDRIDAMVAVALTESLETA